MATIRTQVIGGQRRVLTKLVSGQRRVSCSCCESPQGPTCCVYPAAECARGPASVLFYGQTLSGDGNTYGNTTNGVIRESDVWAIYRNGSRTTDTCLRMAISGSIDVAANLASSYNLELSYEPSGLINTTLNFSGAIGSGVDPEFAGLCVWSGNNAGAGQDFDEGFSLIFDALACRWLLGNGPLSGFYGFLESGSPTGSYSILDEFIEFAVIS